jgi:hypothetical protein
MKTLPDQIEANEPPLDVVLPLNTELELQEFFHLYHYHENEA